MPLINCDLNDDELFCNVTNIAGLSNVNLFLEQHVGCDLDFDNSDETFETCRSIEYGTVILDDKSHYFLHLLTQSTSDRGSIGSSSHHWIMNCSSGIVFSCFKSNFTAFDGFTSNYEQCDIYESGVSSGDTVTYFLGALDFQQIKSYSTLEELPCDNVPINKIFTGPNTCFSCQETCDCPFTLDPVCGADGISYANSCRAECAGVTWTAGPCTGDCINQDYLNLIAEAGVIIDCATIEDPVCGCDDLEYVNSCLALINGVMTTFDGGCDNTCDCDLAHDPVCGADGKTYANPCRAECAGVTWTMGACGGACINQDYLNLIAEAGVVIDCAPIDDPVCGCDGQTYLNSCIASVTMALTSWAEGECGNAGNLICSVAINLSCGTSHEFGTFQEPKNVDAYCNESNIGMTGGEVVYRVEPPITGTYTFRLAGISSGRDLDMFLLSSCDPDDCIADSDGSSANVSDVISQTLDAGRTYYLVVDTDEISGSGESNYTISMEGVCSSNDALICDDAIELSCGTSHEFGTFQEPKNVDAYCNESNIGMTGGEVVYRIIPPITGAYTFRLTGILSGRDLDMFLLGSCDPDDCIADSDGSSANVPDIISQALTAGRIYYLVVDTDEISGSGESNYTISIQGNCGIPDICPEDESYTDLQRCPDTEVPVCGCDDLTYSTYCEALLEGVTTWTMGACDEPSLCCEDLQTIRLSYKIILSPEDGGLPPFSGDLQSGGLISSWVQDMNQAMIDLSMPYRFTSEEFMIGGIGAEISQKYYAAESRDTARALEADAEALQSMGNPYLWRDDHVNIYLNQGQSGGAGGVCSFPFSIFDREIIIVESSNSNWETQLHELGHFFGLFHTQGRTCGGCDEEQELCRTIPGEDDIEDTLPDLACWDDDDIARYTYGKNYNDLTAQAQVMVDGTYRNIMSYHGRRTFFTKGQIQKWCRAVDEYPSRRAVVGDYCPSVDNVLICTQATPIDCGDILQETTIGKPVMEDIYCAALGPLIGPLDGGAAVFIKEPKWTADYTIKISGVPVSHNLVIIVLNSCDANDCLANSADLDLGVNDELTVLLEAGATYYIVVDTDLSGDGIEHDFEISITCETSCDCPTALEPVCGTDGKSYANACRAICAGVTWFPWPCAGDCINQDYLDMIDELGTIIDCTSEDEPVCGCDEVTYLNKCFANLAGVMAYTDGDCSVTTLCFSSTAVDQDASCPLALNPVCNCDNKTYLNGCTAESNGITEYTEGTCDRSATPELLTFYTTPASYVVDGIITFQVKTRYFDEIRGFQYTLAISDAMGSPLGRIVSIEDVAISPITGQVNQHTLPILWDSNLATTLADDATLFNIKVHLDEPSLGCVIISFINTPTDITANSAAVGVITPQTYGSAACLGSQYGIAGSVRSASTDPIDNTTISVSNLPTRHTDSKGNYAITDLSAGTTYTIIPTKNDEVDAGVNIADVVHIRRHILAIEPLPSPYDIIAADVTRNGSIDVADVNEVSDLIIGRISQYTYGDAWRFIPASFLFTEPLQPFATSFPESLMINGPLNQGGADFTAIKLGDVNASYKSFEHKDHQTVDLRLKELTDHSTHQRNLQFTVDATAAVYGLQFALKFDQSMGDLICRLPQPYILHSYHATDQIYHFAITSEDGLQDLRQMEGLVEINFQQNPQALSSVSISNTLQPLAMMKEKLSSIIVTMSGDTNQGTSTLLTVHPSPFSEQLTVTIHTTKADSGTISIYDVMGHQLAQYNTHLTKGKNSVLLQGDIFKKKGIYIISIRTEHIHQFEKVLFIS